MCFDTEKITQNDVSRRRYSSSFLCSENDFQLMRDIFMKYNGLTPILEEDHSFQLVLHQRDFTPGVPILANIADVVVKSRRMIMLLSK